MWFSQVATPDLGGRQVAILRPLTRHFSCHVTSAAYSCPREIYVRHSTKYCGAQRSSFGEGMLLPRPGQDDLPLSPLPVRSSGPAYTTSGADPQLSLNSPAPARRPWWLSSSGQACTPKRYRHSSFAERLTGWMRANGVVGHTVPCNTSPCPFVCYSRYIGRNSLMSY